jgi:hypothetical protein
MGYHGLEHHESSNDGMPEHSMSDDEAAKAIAYLLPHEYVHSWNGKYRRPAGLVTPTYQEANNTRLLWVYEGLTEYLGTVLTARSGLWTARRGPRLPRHDGPAAGKHERPRLATPGRHDPRCRDACLRCAGRMVQLAAFRRLLR